MDRNVLVVVVSWAATFVFVFLTPTLLLPAEAHEGGEAGYYRERGTGAKVLSVDSPDGLFPTQLPWRSGRVTLPRNPHWLGTHILIRFRGWGFFPNMHFTLQNTNVTQCSEMYNINRNATWMPFTNITARGNTSFTYTRTETGNWGNVTPTYVSPEVVEEVPHDFYPFDFSGVRAPLMAESVSEDGTEANFSVPLFPYFWYPAEQFLFCLESPPLLGNSTRNYHSATTTPTVTATESLLDPMVDYTIDSGVFFEVYDLKDVSLVSQQQAGNATLGFSHVDDKPPYHIAFGEQKKQVSFRGFIPNGGAGRVLYTALSESRSCGALVSPVGWSSLGEVRTNVEQPMFITKMPDRNSSLQYYMQLSQPETLRASEGNTTLFLCVKGYETHWLFHPIELSDSLEVYGKKWELQFKTILNVASAAHLNEKLDPDQEFRVDFGANASDLIPMYEGLMNQQKPHTQHNNTIRFIQGHKYTVYFTHVGLHPFMKLSITSNHSCSKYSDVIEVAKVHLQANETDSAFAVFFPKTSYLGARLCLSKVGPFINPEYTVDLGFRVASYRIDGVEGTEMLHEFAFGETGLKWVVSENLEQFVRIKFEGGDGMGSWTGDDWTGTECSSDERDEHQPAYIRDPAPGMYAPSAYGTTSSQFYMNYTISGTRWRARAFVCIATYPWEHSRYETMYFKASFITNFLNASFLDQAVAKPHRIFLYSEHEVDVKFHGMGLWPEMRLALGAACLENMQDKLIGTSAPAVFDMTNPEHTYAEFHTPTAWVAGAAAKDSKFCMSAFSNGTAFPLDTGWTLTVMKLLEINKNTYLPIVYGMSDKVFQVDYTNGEVGIQIAFLPECDMIRRTCAGTPSHAGYCSDPDPFSQAIIAGCKRNPLGEGGVNDRKFIASNVPPPGNIMFIYNCQSSQHAPGLKVCCAPISGSVFRDTGLRVSFVITVTTATIDSMVLPEGSNLKVYVGAQPTVKFVGTGLYGYMRIASMPNCTDIPYEEYYSPTNASWTSMTRQWGFVKNSNNSGNTELQFTPTLASTSRIVTLWKLCMSEYATHSEYPHDFSIEIPFTFTVVELKVINNTRFLTIPYGERLPLSLHGFNLEPGMQIKIQQDCGNYAPTTDVCRGTLGAPFSFGCNVLSDDVCYKMPASGQQLEGLWFFLFQSMSSQNTEGLKVCLSLWPATNQQFYDTGLRVNFLVNVGHVSYEREQFYAYQTLLLYRGYNNHPREVWPANDPRYRRTVTLEVGGKGFRDGFRVKLQRDCGSLNMTEGGPPVALRPLADGLGRTPDKCGYGDIAANIYLTPDQTDKVTSDNLHLCFSVLSKGTRFDATSNIYIGIVDLTTISMSGASHVSIPYGFVGQLTLYGASLMPFSKVMISMGQRNGLCDRGSTTFDEAVPLQSVEGTPRCEPRPNPHYAMDGGVRLTEQCLPYEGLLDRRYEGGFAATISLDHSKTFRQVENLYICLAMWGSTKFYVTPLTITSIVLFDSVESYGKHHLPNVPEHQDIYVYTRYPDHVITLHGKGFFEHHRVAFMKGQCGQFNYSKPLNERLGPFAVEPVLMPNQTFLRTTPSSSGSDRVAALVRMKVASNMTGLVLCYSVFAANDRINRNNFTQAVGGIKLTSVDLFVLKYFGKRRDTADPIQIVYGKTERLLVEGTNLLGKANIFNQFLLNLNDNCDTNVTVGAGTPAAMTYINERDPVTQRIVQDVPAFSFPASVTRQYAHRKICFSPYKLPYHKFLDTGYRVYLECADPAFDCSDGTLGICDANATKYHQLSKGCKCSYSQRTNYSCALDTRIPCDPLTTCSGHGACGNNVGLCQCDNGYYGADCSYCDLGIYDMTYTDTLKHAVIQFTKEYTHKGLEVAAGSPTLSCDRIVAKEYMSLLGDPRCYWETPSQLHVFAGHGANAHRFGAALHTPGISAFCGLTKGGDTPVIIPHTLPTSNVSAFLLAPHEVGPCDGITLDASFSTAPGGEMEFYFSLDNTSMSDFSPEFDTYIRTRGQPEIPVITIPAGLIPIGTFRVALRVKSVIAGTEETVFTTFTKARPTVPANLVVLLPQRSPVIAEDVASVLVFGAVEVSSFALSNAATTCVGLNYLPPAKKLYKITWSVWWYALLGDVYLGADGSTWQMSDPLGAWVSVALSSQKQNKPMLYLPMQIQAAQGVFDTMPINRSAEVRVKVELFDAEKPALVPHAQGNTSIKVVRHGTALAYFQGGNRTVSTSFLLRVLLRIDQGKEVSEPYQTQWWCNDTSSAAGVRVEKPCPSPLNEIVLNTQGGMAKPTSVMKQGPTEHFVKFPPAGRYFYTMHVFIPRTGQLLVAQCEITVESRSSFDSVGALDAGISPHPQSIFAQKAASGAPIGLIANTFSVHRAGTTYQYMWSVWHSRATVPLSSSIDVTLQELTLPKWTFKSGGTYQVRALVREVDANGLVLRQANTAYDVFALSPPHGGRLRVTTVEGKSLLHADGWVVENGRYPLAFKFTIELFCEQARQAGCVCCSEGQKVSKVSPLYTDPEPLNCEAICVQCTCLILSDYIPRNYIQVTIPRTLEPDTVQYSVTVADRFGSEGRIDAYVATIVDGGSGGAATPPPQGPGMEPWMSDVDSIGLSDLAVAVNKQDVNLFLLTLAQLTTDMQFFVTKQFVKVECFTITDVAPETETVTASETVSLSDTLHYNVTPTEMVNMTTPTLVYVAETNVPETPAPVENIPQIDDALISNTTTLTRPAPRCKSTLPPPGEAPLLPFFPKSKPLGYQVRMMLKESGAVLGSLSSAKDKNRVIDLLLSFTAQPAFLNRASGGTEAVKVAERLLFESTYLNDESLGFSRKLTTFLAQILLATASNLPDDVDPNMPYSVSPVLDTEVRRTKKAQVARISRVLDALTVINGANANIGHEWVVKGGGISRKCKRMWSGSLLSGAQAGLSDRAGKYGEATFPNATMSVCDAAGLHCNVTNLTMSLSGAEPYRGSALETKISACMTSYPTMLHDYSYSTENITGDYTVSYGLRDENGTEISLNEASVILSIPMDPRLYKLVDGNPELSPGCYWFDEEPDCSNKTTEFECENTCCLDTTSPSRARECNGCCVFDKQRLTCSPGVRAGKDEFTTRGCSVSSFDKTNIFCNCTHLTSFVQGVVFSALVEFIPRVSIPIPVRITDKLPPIHFATPPNVMALPQALVFPVLYIVLCLVSVWREQKFRVMLRERQIGGRVQYPWSTSVKHNDDAYIRAADPSGISHYVRALKLSVKSVYEKKSALDDLLGGMKMTHSYLNIIFLTYHDRRTIVNKITALFCGIGASWAMLAKIWMDTTEDKQNTSTFMSYSFAGSLLIAPVSWFMSYLYKRTPRSQHNSPGDYLRGDEAENKGKLRVAHERIRRGMPQDNPNFYSSKHTQGVDSDSSGDEMYDYDDHSVTTDPQATQAGIPRAAAAVAAEEGGSMAVRIAQKAATEIDYVLGSMDPWQAKMDTDMQSLVAAPEDIASRIVHGSSNIPSTDIADDEVEMVQLVEAEPDAAAKEADAGGTAKPSENEDNDADDEKGSILVNSWKSIHDQAMYEVKCARFLLAAHLFYMANKKAQVCTFPLFFW